jgi:hypothetical protein
MGQTLDTRSARAGERFAATLDAPIVVGKSVMVPMVTPFTGSVVAAKNSGRFRGRARLEVRLRSFRMDGVTYLVATVPDTRISGSHKEAKSCLHRRRVGSGRGHRCVSWRRSRCG